MCTVSMLRACAMLAGCAVVGSVAVGCGAASPTDPAGGGQPGAGTFAEKILGDLKMPPGTNAASVTQQVPSAARDPWTGEAGAVDRSRAFTVPLTMTAAETYLVTHGPANAIATGSGTEQGPLGIVSKSLYFHLGGLPPGISDADVQLYLVPEAALRHWP
jgi:hypothetical protein